MASSGIILDAVFCYAILHTTSSYNFWYNETTHQSLKLCHKSVSSYKKKPSFSLSYISRKTELSCNRAILLMYGKKERKGVSWLTLNETRNDTLKGNITVNHIIGQHCLYGKLIK